MSDKMKFDYFYGSQAEQFSFFRLPKVLIRDERFKKISSDAKILYGIMLDRMSLSRENNWLDDENRVFIIFTLKDVMKEFECCQRKAGALMMELDSKSGIGLIEKKKQGLGKPDLIYLKNFIIQQEHIQTAEKKNFQIAVGEVLPIQNGKKMPVQSGKNMQLKDSKTEEFQPERGVLPLKGEVLLFQSGKNIPVQSGKNVHLKSGMTLPANNTDNNYTDMNHTVSVYPIHPEDIKDGMDEMEACSRMIKEQICYNDLCRNLPFSKRNVLDEIVQLMIEVVAVERVYLRIAGTEYPYAFVKKRFLALNQYHVEYVIDCLGQTSSKIGNIKAYILTSLFNAPATIDTYYTAELNHDMVEG